MGGIVEVWAQFDCFVLAIKALKFPDPKRKVVPVRLGHVIHRVVAQVHASRGNFMKLRLPDVGAVFVNERDMDSVPPAVTVAESSGQF